MPPKFKVGDAVILKQPARQNIPGGVCVVTKVLPDRNGEREYRVKSPEEEHERVARGKTSWSQPRRANHLSNLHCDHLLVSR